MPLSIFELNIFKTTLSYYKFRTSNIQWWKSQILLDQKIKQISLLSLARDQLKKMASHDQQMLLFEHKPLLSEILFFLPPRDVFLDFRSICKDWKNYIESEMFSTYYYKCVLCFRGRRDHSIFRIDLPDQIEKVEEPKNSLSFKKKPTMELSPLEIMTKICEGMEKN